MPTIDGVSVRLYTDGKELHEYENPKSSKQPRSLSCYVEIESGQTFSVQVHLLDHYDFGLTNCVRWQIIVDGNETSVKKVIRQLAFEKAVRAGRECVSRDDAAKLYNEVTERWEKCPRIFGNLKILESTEDGNTSPSNLVAFSKKSARNIGSICVTVWPQIEQKVDHNKAIQGPKRRHFKDEPPNEVLKSRLVEGRKTDDKFININVKYGLGVPYVRSDQPSKAVYRPEPGGRPYKFYFRYRDKTSLSGMGVMETEAEDKDDVEFVGSNELLPGDKDEKWQSTQAVDRAVAQLETRLANARAYQSKRKRETETPAIAAKDERDAAQLEEGKRARLARESRIPLLDLTGDKVQESWISTWTR